MAIGIEMLDRLGTVFEDLGWRVVPGSPEATRFNRFVEVIGYLPPAGQSLLVDLTADFLVHGLPEYSAGVADLVDQLVGADYDPSSGSALVVLPLVKEKDLGVPKSGAMVAYLLRAELESRGLRHKSWDRPHLVQEQLPGRSNAVVLLVDDYVGTGESALDAHAFYQATSGNASDQVIVCALVAQEAGLATLRQAGVPVRYVVGRKRGISDSKRLADIPAAHRAMDEIEDLMQVPEDYRRGYGRSEALLSLIRCPNNTFPVYWMRPRGEASWAAPFAR